AQVADTFKVHKAFVHHVKVKSGNVEAGKEYALDVDATARQKPMIKHTDTNMMHAALRKVLGDRVKQAGSLVDSNRLRFDFTYPRALSGEELGTIEEVVNQEIRRNSEVSVSEMSYDDALKSGALAFFDEKYGAKV